MVGASESSWGCTLDCPQPINIRHSGRVEEGALQWAMGTGTEAAQHFCGLTVTAAERFGRFIRQCKKLLECNGFVELIHTVAIQNSSIEITPSK